MKSAALNRLILDEPDSYTVCYNKLLSIGQQHLLAHLSTLSPAQKKSLKDQVEALDIRLFHRMRALTKEEISQSISPFTDYTYCGNQQRQERGMQLVKEGKIALAVLAGGQGTRLRYPGPKGCYPVTLIKHKSLFQLLAEKVQAASIQADRPLQLAIMTSPLNHLETQAFFEQHAFFGLMPSQVTFFAQGMWPLMDLSGNFFLEEPAQIAHGPNGNGAIFQRLVEEGIWEKWKQSGIEIVNIVPIDNPLAAPFDFELFAAHATTGCEVSIKATLRRDAHEHVGVLAQVNGKTTVVEYTEMSTADKEATDKERKLKFGIANLSLFSFSMPFIQKMSSQLLPLHRAKKEAVAIGGDGPNAWKFEQFIFDVLPYAENIQTIVYPRGSTFAPLKNLKGEDSIESVQAALLAFDRQRYEQVTGVEPPQEACFELAPPFYYPTVEMLKKWKGRPFPKEEYIDE